MNPTLVSALLQPTNLVFFGMMIVLALIDIASYFWKAGEHHRNFKGEIVGLGILGTFFGIFIGLQTFDPRSIQESIPPLLDGLKTAFLTSIAGMGISMLLTVFQTIVRTRAALRADDPLQALVQRPKRSGHSFPTPPTNRSDDNHPAPQSNPDYPHRLTSQGSILIVAEGIPNCRRTVCLISRPSSATRPAPSQPPPRIPSKLLAHLPTFGHPEPIAILISPP